MRISKSEVKYKYNYPRTFVALWPDYDNFLSDSCLNMVAVLTRPVLDVQAKDRLIIYLSDYLLFEEKENDLPISLRCYGVIYTLYLVLSLCSCILP